MFHLFWKQQRLLTFWKVPEDASLNLHYADQNCVGWGIEVMAIIQSSHR